MIRLGKYEVCFLDLLTEESASGTKKLSSHQIWQHIGFSVITYKYFQIIGEPSVEMMVAFGTLVAGSKILNTWIKFKYGVSNANTDATASKD